MKKRNKHKYKYMGDGKLLLVIDNVKYDIKRGDVVTLPMGKVKTRKLRQLFRKQGEKHVADEQPLSGEELKQLRRILRREKPR